MVDHRKKAKITHRPPSRMRYEQSHPVVSCRLSRDEHELLTQRLADLGGVSFASFLKNALGVIRLNMVDVNKIKEVAFQAGYEQGKQDHQIWYRCAVCRERIDVAPKTETHRAILDLMKQQGWGHASCHER